MNSFEQSNEIEARLMEAVEEWKILYESAKEQYLQALNRREDLGRTHPDGALTYLLALRNRNQALGSYIRALVRFSRFILHGELPEAEVSAGPRKRSATHN